MNTPFEMHCDSCNRITTHRTVAAVLDPRYTATILRLASARAGIRRPTPDYRTVQCAKCAAVSTLDFAIPTLEMEVGNG